MIAGGVVSVKDGVVSAYIEWGLGGDTSPIPPTYYHLGYEIYNPDPLAQEVSYVRFCYGFTPVDRVGLAVEHIKNFLSSA